MKSYFKYQNEEVSSSGNRAKRNLSIQYDDVLRNQNDAYNKR